MDRLIKNKVYLKSTICFDFEFDKGEGNRETKHVEIASYDKVLIKYFDHTSCNGQVISCIGRVAKIIHVSTRNYTTDIHLKIDASTDMSSNTFIVPAKNILDIDLVKEDETTDEDVVTPES